MFKHEKTVRKEASGKFIGMATVARGCWTGYPTSREQIFPLRKENKLQFTSGGGEKGEHLP